jgi:hypothetical protein
MAAGRTAVSARIAEWLAEFQRLGAASEKLPTFLADRLVDAGLLMDDSDVVAFRSIGGTTRRLRVTGIFQKTDRLCLVQCAPADGSEGFEILPVTDVVSEDAGKLATLLPRLMPAVQTLAVR